MRMTTDGIVIRTSNIDEGDRLITLLSGEYGVLRTYAGHARRLGNKLSASTEFLCYSRFVLFKNKERYTLDTADSNTLFWGIRQDMDKLALSAYWCALSLDTSPSQAPAREQLRLLLNCLHLLETGKRDGAFLKPLFELRQIALAGYQPDLVACARCGKYESGYFNFYPVTGQLHCLSCDQDEHVMDGFMVLPPSVVAAMRHIIYAHADKLFSFALPDASLQLLGEVCECYVQTQLSHSFKALEFYNSLFDL